MSGFDGKTYPYRVSIQRISPDGEVEWEQARDMEFPRVSTITKIIDKSDMLISWAYNGGLEGAQALAAAEVDIASLDIAELKTAMKAAGFSPFVRRARAADRGTAAHNVLEMMATGKDRGEITKHVQAISSEEIRGYCWAAINFWDDQAPETILVEEPVVSLRHSFAGTFDLYAKRDHIGCVLTDAKTSKDVYPEMALQLGGYAIGLEETYGEVPDACSILLLRADGTWKEIFIEPDREGFLDALRLSSHHEANKDAVKAARKAG